MSQAMFTPPSRAAALVLWQDFLPRAGVAYTAQRNIDPGPDQPGPTSRLSPYLRHRTLTEAELATETHALHGASGAKFIEELCWRTYWKGWLEAHPAVWRRYREEGAQPSALPCDLGAARGGRTGINCFDAWVSELKAGNYLHNHTRMWFASIWVHTLRLPWALGARFFEDHLLDFDPASNTLSWRWVAGLHTVGKTYLARADNIARFTAGRFSPQGLAETPIGLSEPPAPLTPLPTASAAPDAAFLLCLHDDDLDGDGFFQALHPQATCIAAADMSGHPVLEHVRHGLRADAAATHNAALIDLTAEALIAGAVQAGVRTIVMPFAPVGPTADAIAALAPALRAGGLMLHQIRRPWDEIAWPRAQKGFFAFRTVIPTLLAI